MHCTKAPSDEGAVTFGDWGRENEGIQQSQYTFGKNLTEKYIRAFGAERMAFGTDYPLWDPVKETKRFMELKLTDEEFDQIGHKTVEQLLKL